MNFRMKTSHSFTVSETPAKKKYLVFRFTRKRHHGINVIRECMSQFTGHHVYKYKLTNANEERITCIT